MKNQEIKRICITNSYYVLLVFLLLSDDLEDILFILGKDIKINLIKSCKIIYLKNTINEEKKVSFLINHIINYLYFKIKLRNISKQSIVFGQDHLCGVEYFKEKFKFYIIEDGISYYLNEYYEEAKKKEDKKNYFYKKIKKFFKLYPHHGLDERLNTIYMSGVRKIPNILLNKKIRTFNLEKLWNQRKDEDKEKILSFFNNNIDLENLKNKKILLLTQPLSEDSLISEKEKIEIYSKILKKYNIKEVIIKKHPREQTEYSKYFGNACILEEKIPIELLTLNNFKIEKVITLFSTAIFNFNKEIKIDFYGTKVHPKLLEKWGDSDLIMKANAFLDEGE